MNDYKSSGASSTDIWNVQLSCSKVPVTRAEPSRLAPLDIFAANYIVKRPPEYTIEKLHELISDPITSDSKPWISHLLGDFLRNIGEDGYKVRHLTAVMQVLEFLAWRARDVEEYQIHLDKMLALCKQPPLLEKTSDCLRFDAVLEQYFSTLGYLMVVLPTDREILEVLEALCSLLVRSKPAIISSVKLELCHRTMERSRLPIIVTKLSEICSPEIYHRVLDLVLVLVTISNTCCYRMLEAGILDYLFVRMSESKRQKAFDRVSSEDDDGEESRKEKIILTTNIVWSLMQSIIPPKKLPSDFEKLPETSMEAMRSLQNVFRYQVCHSRGNTESLILRNDLAVLILAGLVALPSWRLVKCGLAEDLIILSIVNEAGIEGTWTENVSFDSSNENLIFKKIMLTILHHLLNRAASIAIMLKRRVMPAILEIINPEMDNGNFWSSAQFWYLSQFAMRTLTRLATKMPEEFARYKGPVRLLMLVERSLTTGFEPRVVMEFTKTICSIVTLKYPLVLRNFREEGAVSTLIKLVNRISTFGCLTIQHQRILTLLMTTIEEIMNTDENFHRRCDAEILTVVTRLLHRCFYQRKEDFPLDQRLLISIGSYIWKRVVRCPEMRGKFVDSGGIYTILDVIENASFPVRCVYLGILTDISSNQHGAPHLCTWRGVDGTKGFVSLMAKCWREEEIRTGVKRTTDGCIDDVELPMMGTEQWINAFHARATYDFSPALASMLGSVRPKIYSLRKIMISEADRYEKSKERYKILLNDLPVEDHITMYIADHFYRFAQGELWSEISRYLEQIGVNLLGMDGEITLLMNQRQRDWGMYVRGLQDKLLTAEKKIEIERERHEIARIRVSRLGTALSALREIDYIRRTTERDYMISRKTSQRYRVNAALKFPDLADDEHCHRSFDEKWNVTAILDHNHTIPSVPKRSTEITDLLPDSSASSALTKIQQPSEKCKHSVTSLSIKCLPMNLMKPVGNRNAKKTL